MGILATQATTPIIGQIAWLLGKLMDGIFRVLDKGLGIQNIGLCIIIFTIIIYTLMLPLTIKQQRFSKMSAVMNPELQKIQNKYKNKKDQASMLKMQEETKLVYEKYGSSPTGGCLPMLVQFPILFGLYDVIRNIPAYVSGIKEAYMPLVNQIMATDGFQKVIGKIGEAKPVLMSPEKYDYSQANTIIDALYKFQNTTWDTLKDKFPDLSNLIDSTMDSLTHLNSFIGINIAETPASMFMNAIKAGAVISIILAISIPVLSGITQWVNIKLMPQAPTTDENNSMAASMKMMNMFMPVFSIFMCFTLPAGLGLYWIASAVVRSVQQGIINSYLNRKTMDDLIEANVQKAKKKREKKGVSAKNINQMAQKSVRNIEDPSVKKNQFSQKEKEDKLKKAADISSKNVKPGSLAAKANMVQKFNQNNK